MSVATIAQLAFVINILVTYFILLKQETRRSAVVKPSYQQASMVRSDSTQYTEIQNGTFHQLARASGWLHVHRPNMPLYQASKASPRLRRS